MTSLLFAISLVAAQAANLCDVPRRTYDPCVGAPFIVWFCGRPTTSTLVYAPYVDNVAQSGGILVRRGYDLNSRYLTPPDDISSTGLVQYITSNPIMLYTSGAHTIQITYGVSNAVTLSMTGSTSIASLTQPGVVTSCPTSANR